MGTGINAVGERGKAREEHLESFRAAPGEAFLLPDLIEAARIAFVALNEIAAANFEPAGDPDVDGVGLGQGRARAAGRKQAMGRW